MPDYNPRELTEAALAHARALGADIAGATTLEQVRSGPSYITRDLLPDWHGVGSRSQGRSAERVDSRGTGVVVVGVAHPSKRPELDWWRADLPSRTLGNQALAAITTGLAAWLGEEYGLDARDMPYFEPRGGVFLKDAAVYAGLGVVGRSNLFLCPELGPRVRLRAMAVTAELTPAEPLDWDPCPGCDELCRRACPQSALSGQALPPGVAGPPQLPARDGAYERATCNVQMEADIERGREIRLDSGETAREVHYCRRCEMACPVGR